MVNDRLKQLYQEFILRHNREPFHYGKVEQAQIVVEAYNPICGDQYQLFPEIKDGVMRSLYFHGYGCSISKAATSVLAEKMEGLSLKEAITVCESYLSCVQENTALQEGTDPDFAPFAYARNFPGREECAVLSWKSLLEFFYRRDAETQR